MIGTRVSPAPRSRSAGLATWLRPATYARHHETKRGQMGV